MKAGRLAGITTDDATSTIVLAYDHKVMRSGLRMLLQAEADLEVRAEAGDIEATFRQVRGHRPTVLLLDLNMPGGSSITAIPRLKLMPRWPVRTRRSRQP